MTILPRGYPCKPTGALFTYPLPEILRVEGCGRRRAEVCQQTGDFPKYEWYAFSGMLPLFRWL